MIEEDQAQKFADIYFKELNVTSLKVAGKLSPKLLMVKPQARLSWQYHHRRAETWRVKKGPVGVVRSFDETEGTYNNIRRVKQLYLKKENDID